MEVALAVGLVAFYRTALLNTMYAAGDLKPWCRWSGKLDDLVFDEIAAFPLCGIFNGQEFIHHLTQKQNEVSK